MNGRPRSEGVLPAALVPAVVVMLFGLLPGCGGQTAIPPVADSTAVVVLGELFLIEARQELYGEAPQGVTDSVLKSHGLDSTRFEALLDFYAQHPDRYAALYSKVLDYLAQRWDLRATPYRPAPDSVSRPGNPD